MAIPIPDNEEQRLQELYSLNILDTENEAAFDQLVELASFVCNCRMSLITLIDRDRQWFKSRKGFDDPEIPREESICAHAIMQDQVFIVDNLENDSRFMHFSAIAGEPHIRFYAGAPIVSTNGYNLGTVCVFDDHPKFLSEAQINALRYLSTQAAILMDYRRKNDKLSEVADIQQKLKEKAEKASKAQEQFLSTMSHEIRTPLNGVIGITELLIKDNPQPHQLENLASLKFASESLLHVVNDILDYNKIAGGYIDFQNKPFSIARLFHELSKPYVLKAREKGIEIFFDLDQRIPDFVIGDPARLTQVLNNLIGNAVKFTSQGSIRVRVRPEQATADRVQLLFEVEDTGIGIAKDKLSQVFRQFSQAHSGIAKKFGGTGLGLSISQKLVQLQGSEIKLSSTLGKGSCFSFSLGFGIGKEEDSKHANAEADLAGLRILVVDDHKMNRMLLRKMLASWKVEVEEAENGLAAIQLLAEKPFDLVLMDLQMPEMDGQTATSKLRAERIYTGPVIALTADAFVNSNNDIGQYGFNDYLVKPFRAEDLQQKIGEQLGR
ncbi:MAG TPA: response regulator [Flavisolibacter sp.]|nr:response regulator [Flavisolibacter sp.]